MSYAIVRNEKLTRAKAQGICVHNDRRARNHKNKGIDLERTHLNYYLKKNQLSYVKEFDLEWEYKNKIRKLEKENSHLKKVVDKFKDTVQKFIKWIVKKFDITDENKLVRDFERENYILLDVEKQVKRNDKEKGLDLEK